MQIFKIMGYNWRLSAIVISIMPLICFLSMFLIERPYGIYIFFASPIIIPILYFLLNFLTSKKIEILLKESSIVVNGSFPFFYKNETVEISYSKIERFEYNIHKLTQVFSIRKKDKSVYKIVSCSLFSDDSIRFVAAFYEKINQYNLNLENENDQIKSGHPFSFNLLLKGFVIALSIFIVYGFLFYLIAKVFGY